MIYLAAYLILFIIAFAFFVITAKPATEEEENVLHDLNILRKKKK